MKWTACLPKKHRWSFKDNQVLMRKIKCRKHVTERDVYAKVLCRLRPWLGAQQDGSVVCAGACFPAWPRFGSWISPGRVKEPGKLSTDLHMWATACMWHTWVSEHTYTQINKWEKLKIDQGKGKANRVLASRGQRSWFWIQIRKIPGMTQHAGSF